MAGISKKEMREMKHQIERSNLILTSLYNPEMEGRGVIKDLETAISKLDGCVRENKDKISENYYKNKKAIGHNKDAIGDNTDKIKDVRGMAIKAVAGITFVFFASYAFVKEYLWHKLFGHS